jgi:hypothetical protein
LAIQGIPDTQEILDPKGLRGMQQIQVLQVIQDLPDILDPKEVQPRQDLLGPQGILVTQEIQDLKVLRDLQQIRVQQVTRVIQEIKGLQVILGILALREILVWETQVIQVIPDSLESMDRTRVAGFTRREVLILDSGRQIRQPSILSA